MNGIFERSSAWDDTYVWVYRALLSVDEAGSGNIGFKFHSSHEFEILMLRIHETLKSRISTLHLRQRVSGIAKETESSLQCGHMPSSQDNVLKTYSDERAVRSLPAPFVCDLKFPVLD